MPGAICCIVASAMGKWSRPEELVGETLEGRFRILRLLGEGGMGAVYEARHVRLDGRVAVKVLDPRLAEDERQRKRFLREARAAVRIDHENVVQITDFGEDPITFFVMEFLQGTDLARVLRTEGKLRLRRTFPIVRQLIGALAASHQIGIVHRDVKPANVFILRRKDGSDFVKVLDFGIAKVPESETRGLTRTDEVIGTALYMSPEQARAQPIDARSDIYSLGALLFEMVTGTTPFKGTNGFALLEQHVAATPPIPSSIEPSVPPAVDAMILKALAKDPNDRFQSMEDFDRAVEAVLESSEYVSGHPPKPVRRTSTLAVYATTVAAPAAMPPSPAANPSELSSPSIGMTEVVVLRDETLRIGVGRDRKPLRIVGLSAMGLLVSVSVGALAIMRPDLQTRAGHVDAEPSQLAVALPPHAEPPHAEPPHAEPPHAEPPHAEPPVPLALPAPPSSVETVPAHASPMVNRGSDTEPLAVTGPVAKAPLGSSAAPSSVVAHASVGGTRTTPKARPRAKTKANPASELRSDNAVIQQIRSQARRCKVDATVRVTFQVMADASVKTVRTTPPHPCIADITKGMTFASRKAPTRFDFEIAP